MKFKTFAVIIIAIVAAAVIGGAAYSSWQKQEEAKALSSNPQTKDAYAKVLQRQKDIRKDKNNYDAYMSLAFSWKGIGEVTKNDAYLRRAADVYGRVIKKWGIKAYLPFLNRANVYIGLKEYGRAEDDLKVALEIDPGEQNLYVSLANLYKGYMNKDGETIKSVYEQGLKTVVGGGNLVVSYASYLKGTGEYKEALKYYKMLQQAYPSNTSYEQEIKELEAKVSKI